MAGNNVFASIDVGTSKTVVLIADIKDEKIHVFGQGVVPSTGVKNSSIKDVKAVAEVISKAVDLACRSCNQKIHNAKVNISDLHLSTTNQYRQISITSKNNIITEKDIQKAIVNASAAPTLSNKNFLNKTVNHFTLDENPTIIDNPLGLEATLLWAQVHLLAVSNQAISNVEHSMSQSELAVDEMVLDSVASSAVCISDEDKEQGVCLLDIGAGTSNLSVFTQGGITYSHVFNMGGNMVTERIADAFGMTFEEAENLKVKHGYAQLKSTPKDQLVAISQPGVKDRRFISLHDLTTIIEKSYLEIGKLIKQDLTSNKLNRSIRSGFVITGGGSKIKNCEQLLFKAFGLRTRLAIVNRELITAKETILNNPIYFSALGLLAHDSSVEYLDQNQQQEQNAGLGGKIKSLFEF